MNIDTENELAYPQEKNEARSKSANLLMGQIILQRLKAEQDAKNGESIKNVVSKTKNQEREIKDIISKISTDTDAKESVGSELNRKTSSYGENKSSVENFQDEQEYKKSITTMMYKATKGNADSRKILNDIQEEQNKGKSLSTVLNKSAKYKANGANIKDIYEETNSGKSLSTMNYKNKKVQGLVSKQTFVSNDTNIADPVYKSIFKKTPKRAANTSHVNDTDAQATMADNVLDSGLAKYSGGSGGLSERGANSALTKSTRDISMDGGIHSA
jgi:hypothetical protein